MPLVMPIQTDLKLCKKPTGSPNWMLINKSAQENINQFVHSLSLFSRVGPSS